MKKGLFVLLVLTVCFLSKGYAADMPASDQDKMVSPDTVQLVEVHNKICPVSHEEVGKDGMVAHKITYKGKVYNLCCAMCEKDFNKDPEKYTKLMEEEAAGPKGT